MLLYGICHDPLRGPDHESRYPGYMGYDFATKNEFIRGTQALPGLGVQLEHLGKDSLIGLVLDSDYLINSTGEVGVLILISPKVNFLLGHLTINGIIKRFYKQLSLTNQTYFTIKDDQGRDIKLPYLHSGEVSICEQGARPNCDIIFALDYKNLYLFPRSYETNRATLIIPHNYKMSNEEDLYKAYKDHFVPLMKEQNLDPLQFAQKWKQQDEFIKNIEKQQHAVIERERDADIKLIKDNIPGIVQIFENVPEEEVRNNMNNMFENYPKYQFAIRALGQASAKLMKNGHAEAEAQLKKHNETLQENDKLKREIETLKIAKAKQEGALDVLSQPLNQRLQNLTNLIDEERNNKRSRIDNNIAGATQSTSSAPPPPQQVHPNDSRVPFFDVKSFQLPKPVLVEKPSAIDTA